MEIVESEGGVLVFDRVAGSERLRCTFNFSDRPATYEAVPGKVVFSTGNLDDGKVGPYSAVIEEIA